ncbi:hypothetical protein RJ641_003852 [Dillenia turbinata]|uniref:COP1-interacting protein 7 n=1 Tax=Dillenia turbinata TaxID=194707 RepID=A0AAN8VLE2_9MAGN
MKSNTRLDSAVFQLTPTRTREREWKSNYFWHRCDLVINANGKSEKIAAGLLNPFLAHLKTAQDQIAKGGYSISLEPEPGSDAAWFTKGTVERFVRFVNTPEVLERVSTLESEILQIEEAIAIQSNNDIGISTVEDHSTKLKEKIERSKSAVDTYKEKAIVLYKPGAEPPEGNGSIASEGNSKVQLLKVLETRKAVLQKEQGMSFARAVAAGFDIDHMAPLISFAECFGASRLMDACLRFLELWKRKHETGQWAEIEAAEEMSTRSEISSLNASGIMLSSLGNKSESQNDLPPESNGKSSIEANADEKPSTDHQVPIGQYPHGMYTPWPVHSSPGALPMFQAYPMQGMPCYQKYPANGPFIQPPYLPMDVSRLNGAPRRRRKRLSMDSGEMNGELETWDMDDSRTRSRDDLDLDKEASQNSRKKTDRLGKKQSGMVVIRNINYITTKKQHSSGTESGSESTSESETDQETVDSQFDTPEIKHKKSSKKHGSSTRSVEVSSSYNNEERVHLKEPDSGHWAAFQSCLLRDDNEDRHGRAQGMFSMEKEAKVKGRHVNVTNDPLIKGRQSQSQEGRGLEFQYINGNVTRRPRASDNELLTSGGDDPYKYGRGNTDGQTNLQLSEIEGRRSGYGRTASDDFVVHGREDQSGFRNSSSVINGYESSAYALDRSSLDNLADEYIVPFRSISVDLGSVDRTAIDMDSEMPSALQNLDGTSHKNGSQNYEPDDMGLTRVQVTESALVGYDPALEYEIQVRAEDASRKVVDSDVKQATKKADARRSKAIPDSTDKKKVVTGIKKGKSSKMSPLDEARARAERLRNFKADLQKAKKEREEEELKRLEALKIERQKRIAARGSSIPTKSPLQSQQTRKLLPTKLSPSSHRGSKFSDSKPGALSPLQRAFLSRMGSGGSNESKSSKFIRKISGSQLDGKRLTPLVSSLPDPKTENKNVTPDPKASMARLKRLSEPKSSSTHHVTLVKSSSAEIVSKRRVSDGPEMKKISAIINLDRAKAATLPELKIKTSKGSSHAVQNKPAAKVTQKAKGRSKSTVTSENSKVGRSSGAHQDDGDDNPVIEKTVVMLECKKHPVLTASNEKMKPIKGRDNELTMGAKTDPVSESAAVHAPASQLTSDRVDGEPIRHQWQEQPRSHEVTSYASSEPQKLRQIDVEKPYQAPFARNSSLEDPCTKNSEYGKAPPTILPAGANIGESAIAHVSELGNMKLVKILEVSDKFHGKDSSKGLRRLLKFGRKNHNSTDRSVSVDSSITEDNAANTCAPEVHTLKNLISQDETPTATTTPHNSSRPFSLLSPFRSKISETKVSA